MEIILEGKEDINMPDNQNSYNVLALYLNDIENRYQDFFKDIVKNCSFNLSPQLFELYISKEISQKQYLNIEFSVDKDRNNSYRQKLINKYIFNNIEQTYPQNIEQFYEMLISIENKIISFIENYFSSSPYIGIKYLLSKIVETKKQNIKKLKEYKSA